MSLRAGERTHVGHGCCSLVPAGLTGLAQHRIDRGMRYDWGWSAASPGPRQVLVAVRFRLCCAVHSQEDDMSLGMATVVSEPTVTLGSRIDEDCVRACARHSGAILT